MTDVDYQRCKDRFLALLEMDAAERDAQLHTLQSEDAALAEAVRRQLEAAGLHLPALDQADAQAAPPAIAQYRLLRELGRGGMGRVWLAERQLGDATQKVALKQILPGAWTTADRRRFERERRILAGLEHPYIAALVDGGTDADGAPYLATVYVDGERLDDYVGRHRCDISARIQLVAKVAAAVAHAHRQMVVHRDLKPANILVGADGEPKLLDFGIARLLGEEALTQTQNSRMTLRYAAPEQVRGDEAGGVAIDVYALGVVLYELLTGVSPYGETSNPSALIAAILDESATVPPSTHATVAGIDADLDAIALRALRKRPHERYASAEALAADLGRWLRREPVEARRGERGYRVRTFIRRRWPWVAAAVVLAALITWHTIALDRQLREVQRERDHAQALADYFGELFMAARPADTERGEVSARELLERSVEKLRADTKQAPQTRAALLLAANAALSQLGRHKEGAAASDLAIELLESMPQKDPAALAGAYVERASDAYKLGDLPGARRYVGQALELLATVDAPDTLLTAQQQAAVYADDAGESAVARAGYERVLAIARTRLDTPRGMRSYLSAQTNLSIADLRIDSAIAEKRLREALEVAAAGGYDAPNLLLPMKAYLARSLVNQRKLTEARPLHEAVLREAREFYGPGDPWLGVIIFHYATLALLDGRAAEAIGLLDARIADVDAAQMPGNDSLWSDRGLRGTAALMHGDWQDAITRLEAVLERRRQRGRGNAPAARFDMAQIAYARCRLDPTPATRAQLAEAMTYAKDWSGWAVWLAKDLTALCDKAVGEFRIGMGTAELVRRSKRHTSAAD
ncbi:serine/threonine-protein kinase [Tahibacter amnicola]|uniref:Serine/threonine protein kinase n=1 Tax=Tahibacter amnicola TaxID=2976241 RepID=A0ABY6B8D8_9GAMM|nr:serine/threonine-protein kinase [Tahibacter amnicola]UXI65827.1 serine/threonine protein kinase [Tahibacter amnicola]